MAYPIVVTGAAGRVGGVGRTITELLLKQGGAVRAMVRNEDNRAQALREASHRHGSAFVYAYVISGEIRSQVDDEPARVYRPGETWFERPGSYHRVSEKPVTPSRRDCSPCSSSMRGKSSW